VLICICVQGIGFAQTFPDSLYQAVRQASDLPTQAKSLFELLESSKYTHVDSSLVWANKLLVIGTQLKDPGIESDGLYELAWLYRTMGSHSRGIAYAGESLRKAEQIQDRSRIANACLEIGMVQREQAEYAASQKSFQRALKTYEEVKDVVGQGRCINALGEVARLEHQYDDAKYAYLEARRLYAQAGYGKGVLVTQNNTGLILEAQGYYKEALDTLQLSAEGARKLSFTGLFLESTDAIARCHLQLGNLEAAEVHAKLAFSKAQTSGHKKYARDAAKTLSDIYDAKNDQQQALDFLRRHYELAHEITNEVTQGRIKNLSLDLELREKENEIAVLNKDREIRRLWSVLAVTGFGLGCVIGLALLFFYRRKRRDNHLLSQQNEALAELVLEKDSLINIVAHDLKSPISKAQGLLSLLATSGEFNGQQQKIAGMIDKVLSDGDRLIRDLLDISQAEGSQSHLNLAQFELSAMLGHHIASHQEAATKKRITIAYDAPDMPVALHTDESFVGRVFDNLLGNAIKYSPMSTTVTVACGLKDGRAWFSVKDQGPGFSPEDQEKMYRKFQRLSARPTGGETSNGLGLAIIRLLVAQLQGEVQLTSQTGNGAAFVVSLPLQLPS
jgi:signal transduction histidine kinase